MIPYEGEFDSRYQESTKNCCGRFSLDRWRCLVSVGRFGPCEGSLPKAPSVLACCRAATAQNRIMLMG